MSTITTREIQQNTRLVRERLMAGEQLDWTMGDRVVAHLTPAIAAKQSIKWEDPLKRLQAIYAESSEREMPSASEIIYKDRG